jgi:hypothetical protein
LSKADSNNKLHHIHIIIALPNQYPNLLPHPIRHMTTRLLTPFCKEAQSANYQNPTRTCQARHSALTAKSTQQCPSNPTEKGSFHCI